MQSILVTTMSNGLYHSIFNMLTQKKEKNIIIDPFSCLTKLCLLAYSNGGTKISITNNQIYFNDPNYSQGMLRFLCGDNREDLHNLLAPIQKAREWFFHDDDEYIVYFFNKGIDGLKNLKKSYGQYETIQHTIDYYIHVLINGNGNNNEMIKKYNHNKMNEQFNMPKKRNKNNEEVEEKNTDLHESVRLDTIQRFLKDLWSEREIKIIIDLFKEYETKNDASEKCYVFNSIISYCDMKEKKLNKFIEEKSSILQQ